MQHISPRFAARAALALALFGCSDGGSDPQNQVPVAVIGDVPVAVRGDTVLLDGTASHDPDEDSLTFAWTLVTAPAGSDADLAPATGVSPSFVADSVGSYVVSLTVNDGHATSLLQAKTISVLVPAPHVTVASPTDGEVVFASPTAISGTVDDPAAIVQVNGIAASVNPTTGAFTVNVPLIAGANPIVVTGTNITGSGETDLSVILNTTNAPVVKVTHPAAKFIIGNVYMIGATEAGAAITVSGTIQVYTSETSNAPTVTVNGDAATITETTFSGCPAGTPKHCFNFSRSILLPRGLDTINVVGTDVIAHPTTVRVPGVSDNAFRPTDTEWQNEQKNVSPIEWGGPSPLRPALTLFGASTTQNNRAHQIDGCSAPTSDPGRNNPMHLATHNLAPTAFGKGTVPPTEYFVHGRRPADDLPCNNHDVCYQTKGSVRETCDQNFYAEMRDVCKKAYPAQTVLYYTLHPAYKNEQDNCYNWAASYYQAVKSVSADLKFNRRQKEFALPPS